jgi:hypothetical protein
MEAELPTSQASSHFALEPILGTTLFELEKARRCQLEKKGTIRTGCPEVDEQILVDGFERGAVVGISAEEIDTGLLVSEPFQLQRLPRERHLPRCSLLCRL